MTITNVSHTKIRDQLQVPTRIVRGNQLLIRYPESQLGADRLALIPFKGKLVQAEGEIIRIVPNEDGSETCAYLLSNVLISLWDERHLSHDRKTIVPIDHLWQLKVDMENVAGRIEINNITNCIGWICEYRRKNGTTSFNIETITSCAIPNIAAVEIQGMFNEMLVSKRSLPAIVNSCFKRIRAALAKGSIIKEDGTTLLLDPMDYTNKEWLRQIQYVEKKLLVAVKTGNLNHIREIVMVVLNEYTRTLE